MIKKSAIHTENFYNTKKRSKTINTDSRLSKANEKFAFGHHCSLYLQSELNEQINTRVSQFHTSV